MASILVANKSYKGLSNIAIRRKALLPENDVIFNLAKPMGAVLSPNIEVRNTSSRDARGNMSRLNTYSTSENATFQLTYGVSQMELFALQTGYMTTSGTFTMQLVRNVTVPQLGVIPPVLTGFVGKGVVADVGLTVPAGTRRVTMASYTNNLGVSVDLEQVAHTTTAYATADQFGVGTDGALTFSTNLIGQTVTVMYPYTVPAKTLGSELVGEVEINFTVTSSDESMTVVNIPSAIINPSGATMDASAENTTITFDLLVGNECRAYRMFDLGTLIGASC
jgi:hypothetical protein